MSEVARTFDLTSERDREFARRREAEKPVVKRCRNGHTKTPENTRSDGRCMVCRSLPDVTARADHIEELARWAAREAQLLGQAASAREMLARFEQDLYEHHRTRPIGGRDG